MLCVFSFAVYYCYSSSTKPLAILLIRYLIQICRCLLRRKNVLPAPIYNWIKNRPFKKQALHNRSGHTFLSSLTWALSSRCNLCYLLTDINRLFKNAFGSPS